MYRNADELLGSRSNSRFFVADWESFGDFCFGFCLNGLLSSSSLEYLMFDQKRNFRNNERARFLIILFGAFCHT
jgi:hypothetical protein